MRSNTKITYGESYVQMLSTLRLENGKFKADKLQPHKERMRSKEAAEYYTAKLRDVFNVLRMANKKEIKKKSEKKLDYFEFIDFEIRLPTEFKRVRNATRQMLNREGKRLISLGFYKEVA